MAQANPLPSGHKHKKTVGRILFIIGLITLIPGLALWYWWVLSNSEDLVVEAVIMFVIVSVSAVLLDIGDRLADISPRPQRVDGK